MSVKIRLSRGGTKNRPYYYIVEADSASPRDGRYIERIGFFNPIATGGEERFRVDTSRVEYWMGQGAKQSERVADLLKQNKGAAAAA